MKRLNLALLSEEEIVLSEDDIRTLEEGVDTSAEDEIIAGQSEEAEVLEQAIEDASEDVQTLGEIGDVVEKSPEALDPIAAEMFSLCYSKICERNGLKAPRAIGMESFTSKPSRQIAIESIGETIKNFFKTIAAAIQRAYESVKEFFLAFFDKQKKLLKMAEAIRLQASKLGSKAEPKITDFSQRAYSTYLSSVHGLADSAKLDQLAAEHVKNVDKIYEDVVSSQSGQELVDVVKKAHDLLKKGDLTVDELAKIDQKLSKLLVLDNAVVGKNADGQETHEVHLFLGQKSVFGVYEGEEKGYSSVKIEPSSNFAKVDENKMHGTAFPEIMVKTCDHLITHLKSLEAQRKSIDALDTIGKQLRDLTQVEFTSVFVSSDSRRALTSFFNKVNSTIVRKTISLGNALRAHDLNVSSAFLRLMTESLKQY